MAPDFRKIRGTMIDPLMRPRPFKSASSAKQPRDPRRKGFIAACLFILWTAWGLQAPLAALASPASPQSVRIHAGSRPLAALAQRPSSEPVDARLRACQRNGASGFDPDRRPGADAGRTDTPHTPVPYPTTVDADALIGYALPTLIGSECARRGMRTSGRDPPGRG